MTKDNEISFNLNLISKYRGQIMGFAILLIMFTHNTMALPGYLGRINSGLRMWAQTGVDIFFLLSGFGCFYSLKSKSAIKFYIKRIERIFYPFIIVFIGYGIWHVCIRGNNLMDYVSQFSLVTFFTKAELSEWFVAAIIVTYLLTPLFFYLINNKYKLFCALFVLLYLVIILSRLLLGHFAVYNIIVEIWFTRLPAFLSGMIIAKIIAEKNASISRGQLYLILSAAIICMLVTLVIFFIKLPSYWLINRLLFLPIILGIIASFVIVGKKTQFTKLDNALKWLGGITLEIYLTHEKILGICDHVLSRINCNEVLGSIIANVIAVIMAVCLAKLLSLLTDLIIKQTKQSTKQTS